MMAHRHQRNTPMIELHHFPGNASMAPHMLLQALGLPHRLVLVDRDRAAHQQPAYLALNPNGLIPVLCDCDLVLYESAAICLYLADKALAEGQAGAGLMPPLGTPQRAHAYKWLVWMSNSLQATLMHYFYPERLVDAGNADGAAQVKAHAQTRVGALLGQLDAQLASAGGPWLLGGQLNVVDFYGLMLCRWTRGFAGTAAPPARMRPVLDAWLQRVLALPAVQRALAAEGLAAPFV